MKRIISVFCLLTVFYLLIFSTYANAQTVSVIYSSYSNGGYFYKNTYKEPFNNAGLKCEEYEKLITYSDLIYKAIKGKKTIIINNEEEFKDLL